MAHVKTPLGDLPLDPSELITLAEAERICREIGADSVQEYQHGNKDESIEYDSDAKIYQIMPGFQSAAQLRNIQAANPVGHWAGTKEAATWVIDANVTPKGPDAGSAAAPNVDFAAVAMKAKAEADAKDEASLVNILALLKKIAAKVGA